MTDIVLRRFADLALGQIHYLEAGSGPPLLILHGSPGSARQHMTLIESLSKYFRVIAPDTPGAGDSSPLTTSQPTITCFAKRIKEFVDVLGLEKFSVYGFHSGGAIATELSLLAPSRVKHLAIEGILVPNEAFKAELLTHYAPPFPADLDGSYLQRIFQFCRDQFLFFPWYKRSAEAMRSSGLPSATKLKEWVEDVLKANESYHLIYRASFSWDAEKHLAAINDNTLVIASTSDPIFESTQKVCQKVAGLTFVALPDFSASNYIAERQNVLLGHFCRSG